MEDRTATGELERVRRGEERVGRAIDAVLAVRGTLTELTISLGTAQGWGQLDLSTFSVAASPRKHGRLAQAQLHQQRLQTLLTRHRTELEALGRTDPVLARITPLDVFADLAEGWLTDWVVQGQINESIQRARALNQRLTDALTSLAAEGATLRSRRAELEERLTGPGA